MNAEEAVRFLPRGIGAKLFAGFLAGALPILVLAGLLLEAQARRGLERELNRRAASMAATVATAIPAETWQLLFALGPGEEESRTARYLRARLERVAAATGAVRVAIWDTTGAVRLDSATRLTIATPAPRARLLRAELRAAAAGEATSTPLYPDEAGRLVKLGLAPLSSFASEEAARAADGEGASLGARPWGVAVVELPATTLGVVAELRRTLALSGLAGILLVALAAWFLSGSLTRRIHRLAGAARAVERGDLEHRVPAFGTDEVGSLARALEAMRQAVQSREQHLRAMVGGVAHEIRNPLGGLMLNAEWLAQESELSPALAQRAARIVAEAGRLERVVSEFLSYARPERPAGERVALDELIPQTAAMARDTLAWEGTLTVDVPPGLTARSDGGHVRQILLNVLLNAMQAAGAAGRVALRAQRRSQDGSERVVVSVEDDGPGIPAHVRARMFEPFYTTRSQGAGLGLAIVRRLCELNEIELVVAESRWEGARLEFELPVAQKE